LIQTGRPGSSRGFIRQYTCKRVGLARTNGMTIIYTCTGSVCLLLVLFGALRGVFPRLKTKK
jgi:hypothetical protein